MTFLSDLTPAKVEETPYFGHRLPWRRDVNLTGEPLKINGQSFDRGLAVHSRCILTYDLRPPLFPVRGSSRLRRLSPTVKAALTAASMPTARRSTPIPTSGPTHRRSSCHCRSRVPNNCGCTSTSAADKTPATA